MTDEDENEVQCESCGSKWVLSILCTDNLPRLIECPICSTMERD